MLTNEERMALFQAIQDLHGCGNPREASIVARILERDELAKVLPGAGAGIGAVLAGCVAKEGPQAALTNFASYDEWLEEQKRRGAAR